MEFFDFFDLHFFIFFIFSVLFFIYNSKPIHNIFLFMLICLQSFIFLALFPKQYFFSFLLLIIYLGAIAVLFLFVVLVIGNSTFNVETISQKKHFFTILESYIFFLLFILFFVNIAYDLFLFFYEWAMEFEVESELGIFQDYVDYVRNLNELFKNNFQNSDLFLFSGKDCFISVIPQEYLLNKKSIYNFKDFENFYFFLSNNFCKPEMFSFFENTNFAQIKVWGATLFLRDAGILYVCAFILFLATLGVIVLVINRKQVLKNLD